MAKAGTIIDAGLGVPERIESFAKTRRALVRKTAPRWLKAVQSILAGPGIVSWRSLARRSEAMAMARYFLPVECF
jgi:hypothetical protein